MQSTPVNPTDAGPCPDCVTIHAVEFCCDLISRICFNNSDHVGLYCPRLRFASTYMDPFDELARLSAPGASGRQADQQPLSAGTSQQYIGISAPSALSAPNMNASPARGNPFVDMPFKASPGPVRTIASPGGSFQVIPSAAIHQRILAAGADRHDTMPSVVQDLLPTSFSGINRSSNLSPMRTIAAGVQAVSAPAASRSSDYSPLTSGLQVVLCLDRLC